LSPSNITFLKKLGENEIVVASKTVRPRKIYNLKNGEGIDSNGQNN